MSEEQQFEIIANYMAVVAFGGNTPDGYNETLHQQRMDLFLNGLSAEEGSVIVRYNQYFVPLQATMRIPV